MAEAGEKRPDNHATSVVSPAKAAAEPPMESKADKATEPVAEKARHDVAPEPKATAVPQQTATAAPASPPSASAPLPKKRGRPAKPRPQAEAPAIKRIRPVAKPAPSKPAVATTRASGEAAKAAAGATAMPKRSYSPRKIAGSASEITKDTLKVPPIKLLKDLPMANTAPEMTETVQVALNEISTKAKAAYEKGTAMVGDYSEFAKGNVEAVVESSKILASGVQELGRDYVAESRSAFEAITADVKDLAAVKSPSEFFQLQTELLKKSFDTAVAFGSKNSEMMLKLTNEALAPLSNRVSLAMEKAKLAA